MNVLRIQDRGGVSPHWAIQWISTQWQEKYQSEVIIFLLTKAAWNLEFKMHECLRNWCLQNQSVSWLPLGGRRFKGKVISLWNFWGLWGHRLDKTWQKSYWVIWKCAHVNRQTLWILFHRNRFLDSSTRGCGRQRSFAFCPLERRLGGGSTTQTGHLRLCHSSCPFKAFEHRRASAVLRKSFTLLTWSSSSRVLGSELILRRGLMSEQPWDTTTGGWGARLFLGPSASMTLESSGHELELGKAMLSGRGLLTSTGEPGTLAAVSFIEQTTNQNMIRSSVTNNSATQPMITKVNNPPLWIF